MRTFLELLAIGMLCGATGAAIARYRGRKAMEGFILGFFLGPFGCWFEAVARWSRDGIPSLGRRLE